MSRNGKRLGGEESVSGLARFELYLCVSSKRLVTNLCLDHLCVSNKRLNRSPFCVVTTLTRLHPLSRGQAGCRGRGRGRGLGCCGDGDWDGGDLRGRDCRPPWRFLTSRLLQRPCCLRCTNAPPHYPHHYPRARRARGGLRGDDDDDAGPHDGDARDGGGGGVQGSPGDALLPHCIGWWSGGAIPTVGRLHLSFLTRVCFLTSVCAGRGASLRRGRPYWLLLGGRNPSGLRQGTRRAGVLERLSCPPCSAQ